MKDIMLITMIVAALLFCGCTEPKSKVWGKGDLPTAYSERFGNSNGARLDFVQNQQIDKHSKVIAELARRVLALEAVDPNGVTK